MSVNVPCPLLLSVTPQLCTCSFTPRGYGRWHWPLQPGLEWTQSGPLATGGVEMGGEGLEARRGRRKQLLHHSRELCLGAQPQRVCALHRNHRVNCSSDFTQVSCSCPQSPEFRDAMSTPSSRIHGRPSGVSRGCGGSVSPGPEWT